MIAGIYAGTMRKRLDVLMVERGLAESREQAKALVMAGLVSGYSKPGQQVADDSELTVERPPQFVSRGGEKLAHALDAFGVDPRGKDCLDLGASTGGFTDCLLQRGAARVIALDVGYGQLHPRLRDDDRVVVLERVNARHIDALPFAPGLITCDVSFISATRVAPAGTCSRGRRLGGARARQATVRSGPGRGAEGRRARSPEVHRRVLRDFCEASVGWDARVAGVVDSGHPGPKGNREFVVHLIASKEPSDPDDVQRRIDAAVG